MSDKRVYFLRPIGHIGPIKIGCSIQPKLRLETYLPWSPIKLELIATAPGGHAQERHLHGMFQSDWLHHEWFSASKRLLALIDHVVENGELPELPRVLQFRALRNKRGAPPGVRRVPAQKTVDWGNAMRAAYEAGASVEALAGEHGRAASGVIRALRSAGVKVRGAGRPRIENQSAEDIQRAETFEKLYVGGQTLQQIGNEFGLSRERVRQILRAFKVESLGLRKKAPRPLSTVEMEVVEKYRAGESLASLCASYGGVYSTLKRAQVNGQKMKAASARRDAKAAEIAAAYRRGVPNDKIMLDFGLKHREEIYRYLKRAGELVRRAA